MRSIYENAPEGFARADSIAHTADDRLVHFPPGLLGAAEGAIGKNSFHILTRLPGESDFEIMDRGRAVHGESRRVTAFHQVDQYGRQAALDHVTAHSPDDGFLCGAGLN